MTQPGLLLESSQNELCRYALTLREAPVPQPPADRVKRCMNLQVAVVYFISTEFVPQFLINKIRKIGRYPDCRMEGRKTDGNRAESSHRFVVMAPFLNIALNTKFLRKRAAAGFLYGLYICGALIMPAAGPLLQG